MTSFVLAPQVFSVASANELATAPAIRMNMDEAGAVWRSNGLTNVFTVVQLDGSAFDTIALVGTNLRSTDSVRVRTAGSAGATESNPIADQTLPNAWLGNAPWDGKAVVFLKLSMPTTGPFVRIDIESTGNPAGYVEVSRLVIGKRLETDGPIQSSEPSNIDGGQMDDGIGFTLIDPARSRFQWKTGFDLISADRFWTQWIPFIRSNQNTKAWLFVPDDASPYLQNQSLLGRMTAHTPTEMSADQWRIEFTVRQV